LRDGDAGNG
jgi:hypothetical protein